MCCRCQLQALLRLDLFKLLPTNHLDSLEAEQMVEEVGPVGLVHSQHLTDSLLFFHKIAQRQFNNVFKELQ